MLPVCRRAQADPQSHHRRTEWLHASLRLLAGVLHQTRRMLLIERFGGSLRQETVVDLVGQVFTIVGKGVLNCEVIATVRQIHFTEA